MFALVLLLWWLQTHSGATLWLVACAVTVLGIVVALYRRWPAFVGPVLFFDLIRTSRRGLHIVLRCLYAAILLVVLFVVYTIRLPGYEFWNWSGTQSLPHGDVTRFAESFFESFILVQFLAVVVLTPVYTAGAIAEEKERRTLEYLLVTDLANREIVLGKLLSRVATLFLLMITGLPFLGFLQLLGGVDPQLVLAAFLATAATMLSLGGLSILCSVKMNRPLSAMLAAYVWMALYLAIGWCIPGVNMGHPVAMLFLFKGSPAASLLDAAALYVMFHGAAAALCCFYASRRLRTASIKPPQTRQELVIRRALAEESAPISPLSPRGRPAVGDNAMLWKEIHAEHRSKSVFYHALLAILFILVVYVGLILIMVLMLVVLNAAIDRTSPGGPANIWVRSVGTPLACLMLLVVAFWSAGTVSRERERQTLEGLRTTPLEREEILFAMWLASILSVRRVWWGLGVVWLLGALTTGLHPLALLLLVAAWGIYAAFVACLGLWFSTVSQSTTQAALRTVIVLGSLVIIPWVVSGWGTGDRYLTMLAPPLSFVVLAFNYDDFLSAGHISSGGNLQFVLAGLLCFTLAMGFLWNRTCAHFAKPL